MSVTCSWTMQPPCYRNQFLSFVNSPAFIYSTIHKPRHSSFWFPPNVYLYLIQHGLQHRIITSPCSGLWLPNQNDLILEQKSQQTDHDEEEESRAYCIRNLEAQAPCCEWRINYLPFGWLCYYSENRRLK